MSSTLPLTALQSAAQRLLGKASAHPQATDQAFLAAWETDAGPPLADVHALVDAVCSADTGAATVMARVRDIVHDLGWTEPGGASRPAPQTAHLVIVVLLVAAEQYVKSRSPAQPAAAELAAELAAHREGESLVGPQGLREQGPEASRAVRGGSWICSARDARSVCRDAYRRDVRDGGLGFRLALRS